MIYLGDKLGLYKHMSIRGSTWTASRLLVKRVSLGRGKETRQQIAVGITKNIEVCDFSLQMMVLLMFVSGIFFLLHGDICMLDMILL